MVGKQTFGNFCVISSGNFTTRKVIINEHKYVDAAAAAAKPHQSCPTLCDPIDGH